uniref:Cyclin-like domain-containing protein n=1 Tax=Hemiselmis andersenii TaxID=464988 RepID=A0A6U5C647_HEMAN
MAANFWMSSHCQEWLRCKADDAKTPLQQEKTRRNRLILSESEETKLRVHLAMFISNLGKHNQVRCRQRVIATATVYLARFFYNNSYKDFHPHLIAATAVYLASKVEEWPVQPNKIEKALRDLSRSAGKYGVNDIVDGEYFLMEELKFNLIVFHPYRPLQQYLADSNLQDVASTAWYLINDSYRLDLCLEYPPHIVAIAAIRVAGTYANQRATVDSWFNERLTFNAEHRSHVNQVVEQLISMYEEYSHLEPEEIQQLLNKIPNPPPVGSNMEPTPQLQN